MPDEVREGSEVFIFRQNPGYNEEIGRRFLGYDNQGRESWGECAPAPLTGKTGWLLEKDYLPRASLDREKVSLGNVIRCRIGETDELPELYEGSEVQKAIMHCQHHHFRLPRSTRLIVAGGEYALWYFTGEGEKYTGRTISTWRGWLMPWTDNPEAPAILNTYYMPRPGSVPIMAMYHEAFLMRAPWEATAATSDWNRVGMFLEGKWPEPLPAIRTVAPPIFPEEAAFDTEYDPYSGYLQRWSMAWRTPEGEPVVYVVEGGRMRMTLPAGVKPRVIVHNGYTSQDLPHLSTLLDKPWSVVEVMDTMPMHHALWSDLEHTLDYIGSIYARTNYWKPLEHINPTAYSAGDALGTYDSKVRLWKELSRDPGCLRKYHQLMRLLPMIQKAREKGYKVHDRRILEVVELLQGKKDLATYAAQAAVGWPINLGSAPQVKKQVYEIDEIHLNPMTGRLRIHPGRPRR